MFLFSRRLSAFVGHYGRRLEIVGGLVARNESKLCETVGRMKVFGVAGHSGMGKTTLLERLIPELSSRGLVVSLIKHSHKNVDIDRPGKDSFRLREAGCKEVLLLGNERWALMHELRGDEEPPLDYLLDRMQHCDVVLIEGFKSGGFPKLEVWRAALARPTLFPDWPGIKAVACDTVPQADVHGPDLIHLDLADTASIADFVLTHAQVR
ncbi:MAG TPA: molybdopterin-guanine dinucleotide biosynthesis protein B [Albitalea sp.]